MKSYLIITALGASKPNTLKQFIETITNCGANVLNSKVNSLGSEFGILLMIEGTWGSIAKIETTIPLLEQKLGLTIIAKRTALAHSHSKSINYLAHVVTIDREGILNDLAQFFSGQEIDIESINTETYIASNGTMMANISMQVRIPITTHIPTLRDRFNLYCDALNLDAALEPIRD